ncbi:MAG TPA: RNA polymerase sigma factor WhiG [Acidimicrobiales bacterium]|nr:RNA polymerase sigma factor WhiG [Acidimicrobiales bacterium]
MTDAQRDEIDALWTRYKRSGKRYVRDQLILQYSPLVKYVAGRVAAGLPSSVDQGDLVSCGMFGLVDAIDKFDPERGFRFETYAITRIRGAIMDELRSMDWVPRSVRAKTRRIEEAMAKLEAELHRAPTDAELADQLSVSVDQLQQMLSQISMTGVAALDELLSLGAESGDSVTLGDTIAGDSEDPSDVFESVEMRDRLREAVAALPERERMVLGLYYYEGLTLAQIGEVVGVTESRICQIHTKSVLQLRSRLTDWDRLVPV